jgi:hypothetical protein
VTSADPGGGAVSAGAQLDEEFTVALGDSIPLDGTEYSIVFARVIEDSRCPTDTTCVWEGNARIEIVLREFATHTPPGGKLTVDVLDLPVELNTIARFPPGENGSGLIVELRRLEPKPWADTPTKGYVATLFARKP